MMDISGKDRTYVWHPFTQMKDWQAEDQLVIERGEGSYLIDSSGRKYLDAVSSLWVNVHGHNHPKLNKAVTGQLGKIAHTTLLGLASPPAAELAGRLVSIAPAGLNHVFYSDNGSTSVEIALKMAFQYWKHKGAEGRTKFAYLNNSYHGDTIGAVSVGGMELFHGIFKPLLFDGFRLPQPYCYRCELGGRPESCGMQCVKKAREIIGANRDSIAALIMEPLVQGAAGMIVHPAGFLREMAALCRENGILLILDEVATGFGRTGKMFASEHEDVKPDLLCVAKGITGGYLPLAATLATDGIFNAFSGEYRELKTFFHGHTYTGNPLACAAAIANLDIFEEEGTLEKMREKILFFGRQLDQFRESRFTGEVRQKGFMTGIEIVRDRMTKEMFPMEDKICMRISARARDHGIITRPLGNVLVLMPPLSITNEEIASMCAALRRSMVEILGS